jgi:putative flippase GtrA
VEAGHAYERDILSWRDRFDRFVDSGPGWGELRGQGFRFVLVGGFVAGVYMGTTTLLAEVGGVAFEISLAIGFALALVTHFTLQRLYVWRHAADFALSIHHQLARYLVMAALQYGVTALITGTLPRVLGVSPEAVYLPTVVVISVTNFLVFRSRIFHAEIDSPQR